MKAPAATSLIATLVLACAAAAADGARERGAACTLDAQCASGFCDRAQCAAPDGVYGQACVPAPRGRDGWRDAKLNTCGAYVCVDDRCRSCTSTSQCRDEYGAPACVVAAPRPGARCGRALDGTGLDER